MLGDEAGERIFTDARDRCEQRDNAITVLGSSTKRLVVDCKAYILLGLVGANERGFLLHLTCLKPTRTSDKSLDVQAFWQLHLILDPMFDPEMRSFGPSPPIVRDDLVAAMQHREAPASLG